MAISDVKKRLRDRPVGEQISEIREVLNREQGPLITELRTRFNELLAAFNPNGDVELTAGVPVGYVPVLINGTEYVIPVYERSP